MPAPRRAVGAVDRPNADLAGIDLEMFGAADRNAQMSFKGALFVSGRRNPWDYPYSRARW